MEIVENTAVKLSLPAQLADSLNDYIDKSEVVKVDGRTKEILVYWGHEELCQTAHILDQVQPNPNLPKLPSPMLRDYGWPGIHKPFDHQRDTASFLSIRSRGFCFNEAGTGKTSAAIWATDYLMNIGAIKKALVICPLSIMYSAWQDDVFKTAMHRTCGVAYGTSNKRKKILEENVSIDGKYPSEVRSILNKDAMLVQEEFPVAKVNFA
jgi:hypothetical protein